MSGKIKKGVDLGEPVKNLLFKLVCSRTDFKGRDGNADLMAIKVFGQFIQDAERFLLDGKFHYTTKDALIRDHVDNLPIEEIEVDVYASGSFGNLVSALEGRTVAWHLNLAWPHFHHDGRAIYIKFDPQTNQFILD